MSRWRRRLIALLVCGAVGGGLYVFRAGYLPLLAHWLDVGQPPIHADYVLVLGGDENIRPFAAAALVKAGFVRRVLLTHVKELPGEEDGFMPAYDQMNRSILVARGVSEACISVIGKSCDSTFDEAQALAKFLDASPRASVLVLTSDYHSRRSRWVFRHVLGAMAERLTFVSAPTDEFPSAHWWCNYLAFSTITSEYLKWAFYLVRYGRLGYWLAGLCLAAVMAWVVCRHR
jgi:uncharacterized SAM-binding protein YcdF (DUF218 family)